MIEKIRHIYNRLTYNPKTRSELHEYWKKPKDSDSFNNPHRYLTRSDRSIFLVELFNKYFNKDGIILEIGCNVGRNLNYLFENGYTNLSGIEINEKAVELLKETYPEMASVANIYNNPVEEVIKELKENQYDVVFTMAVLEHIHTDSEWIFQEMVRISSKYIVTIEDENGYSDRHFPRNYKEIFEPLGMKEIEVITCKDIPGLGNDFFARVFKK